MARGIGHNGADDSAGRAAGHRCRSASGVGVVARPARGAAPARLPGVTIRWPLPHGGIGPARLVWTPMTRTTGSRTTRATGGRGTGRRAAGRRASGTRAGNTRPGGAALITGFPGTPVRARASACG